MAEIKTKFDAGLAFVLGHKKLFGILAAVVFLLLAPLLFSLQDKQTGNFAGGQWQVYTSEALGFSLSFPAGWSVKETDAPSGPDILVMKNSGQAFVRVRGFVDPYLDSKEAITSSIAEYQKSLVLQEGVRIFDFRTEEIKDNIGEFFAIGEFKVNGSVYRFEERGWLSMAGQVLILRAADAPQGFDESLSTMKKIMDSFKLE